MNGAPTPCIQARRWLTLCIILFTPGLVWSAESPGDFASPPVLEQPVVSLVHGQLMSHYSSWAGTRHKLGGSTTKGVDCSSFIQILFQEQFQLELPRSSREQMTVGTSHFQTEGCEPGVGVVIVFIFCTFQAGHDPVG